MIRPPMAHSPFSQKKRLSGPTLPLMSPAAATNILKVEPGSKVSVMTRLR